MDYERKCSIESDPIAFVAIVFFCQEESLNEIKMALTAYFAQKVEEDMDALWETGEWDQEKNEAPLGMPYRISSLGYVKIGHLPEAIKNVIPLEI